MIMLDFIKSGLGVIDGNRYNQTSDPDPRYTFGETTVEGNAGTIRLYSNGKITTQNLGEQEIEHAYEHKNQNFASDCVYATQQHFIDGFLNRKAFETNGKDYLKNLLIQEAIYESNNKDQRVFIF